MFKETNVDCCMKQDANRGHKYHSYIFSYTDPSTLTSSVRGILALQQHYAASAFASDTHK